MMQYDIDMMSFFFQLFFPTYLLFLYSFDNDIHPRSSYGLTGSWYLRSSHLVFDHMNPKKSASRFLFSLCLLGLKLGPRD
jgi:hypothetical protein